jgi:hypothetical protein
MKTKTIAGTETRFLKIVCSGNINACFPTNEENQRFL